MRIIQKELLKRQVEIAKKHNVPLQTVKDIESSIWKYVKKEMSSGVRDNYASFKQIYLKNLGTFFITERRFNAILRAKKRKDDKSTRDI